MTLIEKKTQSIRNHLSQLIGETTVKTYFSYYGIFKDGLMLGLYKDDKFYLKISQKDLNQVKIEQLEPLVDKKLGHIKNYYQIVDSNFENNNGLEKYSEWIANSLQELHSIKAQAFQAKKGFIRCLPNMNLSLERMLKKVNIHTVDELIQYGEINTFVDLIKIGIDVDKVVLFKLYGAIHHKFIYTLSPEIQQNLLKEVDNALYESGLRKRFTI